MITNLNAVYNGTKLKCGRESNVQHSDANEYIYIHLTIEWRDMCKTCKESSKFVNAAIFCARKRYVYDFDFNHRTEIEIEIEC